MKEVEVKAKISDIDSVKNKLIDLGCVFSEPLIQEDTVFLHKSIKFEGPKKGLVALRIRNSNGKIILTLKKQLENDLDKIEREVTVDNFDQAYDILKYMDYVEFSRISKKRVECKYNDLTICLDEVDELGSFIEAEKMTKDGDSKKIQKDLFEFLKTLGVKTADQVFKGYDILIYNKLQKKKYEKTY